MIRADLSQIAQALGAQGWGEDTQVTGVEIDSRRVQPGNLFFALPGEVADGHQYIPQAAQAGAVAAVVSRPVGDLPYLLLPDPKQALADLATWWRGQQMIQVVGITGSQGKTSTKEMVSEILSQVQPTARSQGNFNNELGLPLTLLNLPEGVEVAVLEMGMRGLGQIAQLAAIAKPSVGVITQIGLTHLELLGSQEKIAQAKSELIQALPPDGVAVIPAQGWGEWLAKRTRARILTFGPGGDIWAKDLHLGVRGSTFTLVTPQGEARVELNLGGEHQVENALAATGAGLALGVGLPAIAQGLGLVRPAAMRGEFLPLAQGGVLISDAYNASPDSMKAALKVLKHLADQEGRESLAILGDMLELGPLEADLHQELGRNLAQMGIDRLATVGTRGEWIAQGARQAGMDQVQVYAATDQLLHDLTLRGDEAVLVKASRGMKFETIVQGLKRGERG